jgi:RNA polymerase sigma-70 factor (ECF subfamily)
VSESPGDVQKLSDDVKASWHRFLDAFEPIRPELYRYCRHLTHSPWDAEDLAQDALTRAFVTLGTLFGELPNPRAWIFRVASNLWIDRARRARELLIEPPPQPPAQRDLQAEREAAGALLVRLSPQERAAVVLKDVFDFSLDEVAEALSTSTGAVKAALHRGRGRLSAPESPSSGAPAPGVLEAFAAAFNARDLEGLTQLLLDGATVEIVGVVTEYGRDAPKDPDTGSFAGTISAITYDERGGVPPELLEGYIATSPRCEVRAYRGASILLFWYEHDKGSMVRTVMTVETDGEQIARVRNYFFSPDVIAEICAELAVPYRLNGYRFWLDAPSGSQSVSNRAGRE